MKSNMPPQKDFAKNPQISGIQRSVFNRSHTHKTTFNTGELIPIYVDEILPGDSQDLNVNIFARITSPLEFPIMDNLHLNTFFFFVPARIVWDNWVKFQGEQDDPADSIDFMIPTITSVAGGWPEHSIGDYFGIPINLTSPDTSITNSLPFRCYNLIWNQWFRDENLQDSVVVDKDDGPDDPTDYIIKKRNKRHDYFTSCLPWAQKGDPVGISLAGKVPVQGTGFALGLIDDNDDVTKFGLTEDLGAADLSGWTGAYATVVGSTYTPGTDIATGVSIGITKAGVSGMEIDLGSATSILINDLRLAAITQQLLEIDARGGTRYVEILKAHFGVTSPDFRLQRPEYLGGGQISININPVTQTANDPRTAPTTETFAASQSAYGTMAGRSGYSKSYTEHGYVIGLACVTADLTYQTGLARMWSRSTRYDFFMPIMANLGEQAVLNKEIYYLDPASLEGVFGYQERWSEYRYFPSKITGQFRSNATVTLDAWHLSQDFGSLPVLNSTFIEENIPIGRTLQIDDVDSPQIIFDSSFEIKHARPMPVYSIPGIRRL